MNNEDQIKKDRVVSDERGRKYFDTLVHVKDPRTGKLLEENHYSLEIKDGVKVFTDLNSQKRYYENGDPYKAPPVQVSEVESQKKGIGK